MTAAATQPRSGLDNTTAERLARIEAGQGQTQRDIADLRDFLETAIRHLEEAGEKRQSAISSINQVCAVRQVGTENLVRRIDEHDKRLTEVEKLMPALRALAWVGAAVGLSVIGLIWALITGTASVIFK